MKLMSLLIVALGLTSCANSFYEAQNRPAVEVSVEGRIIRVADIGNGKIEMIRKGYAQSGSTVEHWEDFVIAGEKVTGCKISNIVPRPGVSNSLVWVQAFKTCS